MGEWSDYFEEFPEENPANQPADKDGDSLRARVAREANYPPELLAKMAQARRIRELAQLASNDPQKKQTSP